MKVYWMWFSFYASVTLTDRLYDAAVVAPAALSSGLPKRATPRFRNSRRELFAMQLSSPAAFHNTTPVTSHSTTRRRFDIHLGKGVPQCLHVASKHLICDTVPHYLRVGRTTDGGGNASIP